MKTLALIILSLTSASLAAHSLSPPRLKAIFYQDRAITTVEASNALPDGREFRVELFHDMEISEPFTNFRARPSQFFLDTGEKRDVKIFINDDPSIKGQLWVCTAAIPGPSKDRVIGLVTRVCSWVKLYRIKKPESRGV